MTTGRINQVATLAISVTPNKHTRESGKSESFLDHPHTPCGGMELLALIGLQKRHTTRTPARRKPSCSTVVLPRCSPDATPSRDTNVSEGSFNRERANESRQRQALSSFAMLMIRGLPAGTTTALVGTQASQVTGDESTEHYPSSLLSVSLRIA